MGCAVHSTLPAGTAYTTLELKVNYIRALTKDTGLIRCEGKTIAVGGRIATAEARMNRRGRDPLCPRDDDLPDHPPTEARAGIADQPEIAFSPPLPYPSPE